MPTIKKYAYEMRDCPKCYGGKKETRCYECAGLGKVRVLVEVKGKLK